jgi:hypothetical protein
VNQTILDAKSCAVDIAGQACKNRNSSPLVSVRRRPKAPSMADAPIPSVVAMLVCDQVIVEQGTGKKSLIGVFENVNSTAFPMQARLAIYAKLVDASGHYDFLIRLVNLKDETKVAEIKAEANIDPMAPAEFAINFVGMIFPEPGKYEFQLYANGTYLHRVTMNAILIQGGTQWPQRKSRQ